MARVTRAGRARGRSHARRSVTPTSEESEESVETTEETRAAAREDGENGEIDSVPPRPSRLHLTGPARVWAWQGGEEVCVWVLG